MQKTLCDMPHAKKFPMTPYNVHAATTKEAQGKILSQKSKQKN